MYYACLVSISHKNGICCRSTWCSLICNTWLHLFKLYLDSLFNVMFLIEIWLKISVCLKWLTVIFSILCLLRISVILCKEWKNCREIWGKRYPGYYTLPYYIVWRYLHFLSLWIFNFSKMRYYLSVFIRVFSFYDKKKPVLLLLLMSNNT